MEVKYEDKTKDERLAKIEKKIASKEPLSKEEEEFLKNHTVNRIKKVFVSVKPSELKKTGGKNDQVE